MRQTRLLLLLLMVLLLVVPAAAQTTQVQIVRYAKATARPSLPR